MKRFRLALFGLLFVAGLLGTPSTTVSAVSVTDSACEEDPSASICQSNTNNTSDGFVSNIINLLLFIVGVVSVVVIIIGGLLYVTSAGDSGKVTIAKNTILYAVVGLVLAFAAYAIVRYVISQLITP